VVSLFGAGTHLKDWVHEQMIQQAFHQLNFTHIFKIPPTVKQSASSKIACVP